MPNIFSGLFLGRSLITFVKAIDAAGRVDQFLFTGEKWMTLGTNFDMKLLTERRAGLKRITARAGDAYFVIFWMNFLFHCYRTPYLLRKTNNYDSSAGEEKSSFWLAFFKYFAKPSGLNFGA